MICALYPVCTPAIKQKYWNHAESKQLWKIYSHIFKVHKAGQKVWKGVQSGAYNLIFTFTFQQTGKHAICHSRRCSSFVVSHLAITRIAWRPLEWNCLRPGLQLSVAREQIARTNALRVKDENRELGKHQFVKEF